MTITMGRYYLRTLVVLAALVLAASMLVVHSRPARAAFPGANGKIGFDTTRDVNEEIYAMNPNGTW
jgi:hypothetical protein